MAKESKRYQVKNDNEPTLGNITEEKESELEEFIEYSKIAMGTLGHKVFEKLAEKSTSEVLQNGDTIITEQILYLKRKNQKSGNFVEGKGSQTTEGFVVFKGSQIDPDDSYNTLHRIKEIRQKALINENGILQEDVLFKSPSAAATFLLGYNANGLIEWKTADNKTLKDIEKEL